jgi:hypothetical protein
MREVREFILTELSEKIHSKGEIDAKVRERYTCTSVPYILDLTMKGKIVQVDEFLVPFSDYTIAKRRLAQILKDEGRIYLPLLKPNSAEQHLVEQMIRLGRLHMNEGAFASPSLHKELVEHTLSAPDIVYQFRKKGFIDLTACTDSGIIGRFRRLLRDGIAREFDGRYLHKKVYQELLFDAESEKEQDWILKADALSKKYELPYELVAGIIPKN